MKSAAFAALFCCITDRQIKQSESRTFLKTPCKVRRLVIQCNKERQKQYRAKNVWVRLINII